MQEAHEHFNLLTNNCAAAVQKAYLAANKPVANFLGGPPAADAAVLRLVGTHEAK